MFRYVQRRFKEFCFQLAEGVKRDFEARPRLAVFTRIVLVLGAMHIFFKACGVSFGWNSTGSVHCKLFFVLPSWMSSFVLNAFPTEKLYVVFTTEDFLMCSEVWAKLKSKTKIIKRIGRFFDRERKIVFAVGETDESVDSRFFGPVVAQRFAICLD